MEEKIIEVAKNVIIEDAIYEDGDLLEFIDGELFEIGISLEEFIVQLCHLASKYEHILSIQRSSSSS